MDCSKWPTYRELRRSKSQELLPCRQNRITKECGTELNQGGQLETHSNSSHSVTPSETIQLPIKSEINSAGQRISNSSHNGRPTRKLLGETKDICDLCAKVIRKPGHRGYLLKCGHRFGKTCLKKRFRTMGRLTCPKCHKEVDGGDLEGVTRKKRRPTGKFHRMRQLFRNAILFFGKR